jgi:hypothetical protein
MHTKFCLGSLKGRDHSEDVVSGGRVVFRCNLQKHGRKVLTGFTWLSIGTGGGLLRAR